MKPKKYWNTILHWHICISTVNSTFLRIEKADSLKDIKEKIDIHYHIKI